MSNNKFHCDCRTVRFWIHYFFGSTCLNNLCKYLNTKLWVVWNLHWTLGWCSDTWRWLANFTIVSSLVGSIFCRYEWRRNVLSNIDCHLRRHNWWCCKGKFYNQYFYNNIDRSLRIYNYWNSWRWWRDIFANWCCSLESFCHYISVGGDRYRYRCSCRTGIQYLIWHCFLTLQRVWNDICLWSTRIHCHYFVRE